MAIHSLHHQGHRDTRAEVGGEGLLASFWLYTAQWVLDSVKLRRQQLSGGQCMWEEANTPKSSVGRLGKGPGAHKGQELDLHRS